MKRTAVITGAGRGLGKAIAQRLAADGFSLHLTDLDLGSVEQLRAELGGDTMASRLDVRTEAGCRTIAQRTVEEFGSLDLWINNAGVVSAGSSWEIDEQARRLIIDVNAIGTMNGTLAALEQMRKADRGHIINVVSLAGLIAAPGEVAYAASKHAALAFTLGTMFDLRRAGISRINLSAVCPDGIWTPMIEDLLSDPSAAASFSGHLLTPEEVAEGIRKLIDRPRPLLAVPRRRGVTVRILAAFPRLAVRLAPLMMRDAERRQRRYGRLIESGRWPKSRN